MISSKIINHVLNHMLYFLLKGRTKIDFQSISGLHLFVYNLIQGLKNENRFKLKKRNVDSATYVTEIGSI